MKTKRMGLPIAKIHGLDALYADLPKIACKGLCQECCGPIVMSRIEWERIIKRLGYTPGGYDDSLTCPMLDQKRGTCKVYTIRPMICRIWGLVKALTCPHGCEPERWLTDEEARRFLKRAGSIGS